MCSSSTPGCNPNAVHKGDQFHPALDVPKVKTPMFSSITSTPRIVPINPYPPPNHWSRLCLLTFLTRRLPMAATFRLFV